MEKHKYISEQIRCKQFLTKKIFSLTLEIKIMLVP